MNARDRWLASFSSENTRHTYEQIFAVFWGWAKPRYRLIGKDPLASLAAHRRAEFKDPKTRLHCEGIVAEWFDSLKKSGLDPSSRTTYLAVVRSFFNHILPQDEGSLHLPPEPTRKVHES
jgi:hypothetical protein